VAEEGNDSERDEHDTQDDADAEAELDEQAQEMKAEKNDQRASNGGQERAVLAKKGAHGAGGSAERDEDHGEAGDERERGGKEPGARGFAFAELLHADAGKHGDVARDERQNAGRQEGNNSGAENQGKRDFVVHYIPHHRYEIARSPDGFRILFHSPTKEERIPAPERGGRGRFEPRRRVRRKNR